MILRRGPAGRLSKMTDKKREIIEAEILGNPCYFGMMPVVQYPLGFRDFSLDDILFDPHADFLPKNMRQATFRNMEPGGQGLKASVFAIFFFYVIQHITQYRMARRPPGPLPAASAQEDEYDFGLIYDLFVPQVFFMLDFTADILDQEPDPGRLFFRKLQNMRHIAIKRMRHEIIDNIQRKRKAYFFKKGAR